MSEELREELIETLSNPQDYHNDIGPPNKIMCLATISFTDEEKHANVEGHTRPIYISGIFGNKHLHV